MKNLLGKTASIITSTAVLYISVLANAPQANAAVYQLSWQGNSGYSAKGSFSFDDSFLGQVITSNELSNFNISFFNPSNTLLQTFNYSFPLAATDELNFTFDSVSGIISQTGSYDAPDGFDTGIKYNAGETGLDFYSADGDSFLGQPSLGTLVLENNLTPQGCSSFPSTTCDRLDIGGTLTATKIPEPGISLGVLSVGFLSLIAQSKRRGR